MWWMSCRSCDTREVKDPHDEDSRCWWCGARLVPGGWPALTAYMRVHFEDGLEVDLP